MTQKVLCNFLLYCTVSKQTHEAELEVSSRVPYVHGHLFVVQDSLVAVHLGHLRRIVHDEAASAVTDYQGCKATENYI